MNNNERRELIDRVLNRVGCLYRELGGVSRTYAHSRRQVRSFAPVLRGLGRRAARGGSRGWSEPQTGGLLKFNRGAVKFNRGAAKFSRGAAKALGCTCAS